MCAEKVSKYKPIALAMMQKVNDSFLNIKQMFSSKRLFKNIAWIKLCHSSIPAHKNTCAIELGIKIT